MDYKQIYLIRHGETEYNKMGVVQGSGIDADLNDTGRNQAAAFFDFYKHIPFQKVYTSALKRTHQTVKNFTDAGIETEAIADLNEISWGEKEGRVPNNIDDIYYKELLENWSNGMTSLAPLGGESPEDVALRLKRGIEAILKNKHEELILVCMHGRAMRVLLSTITNLPLTMMDTFPHQNTCLYRLQYSYAEDKFEILSRNEVLHLQPENEMTLLN